MALTFVSVPCGHIVICLGIELFLGLPCYSCGQTVELMSPNPDVIDEITSAKQKHAKIYDDEVANKTANYIKNFKSNVLLCFDNAERSSELTGYDSIEYIEKHTQCLLSEIKKDLQAEIENLKITHDDNCRRDLRTIFEMYIHDL